MQYGHPEAAREALAQSLALLRFGIGADAIDEVIVNAKQQADQAHAHWRDYFNDAQFGALLAWSLLEDDTPGWKQLPAVSKITVIVEALK
jgi:hypothetical protein